MRVYEILVLEDGWCVYARRLRKRTAKSVALKLRGEGYITHVRRAYL